MWLFELPGKVIYWMVVTVLLIPYVTYGADQQACDIHSSTQADLNQCAADRLNMVDDELNRVYQAILKQYKAEHGFLEKLRNAQRAWLAFRDAELEARFPAEDKQSYYGSTYSMCAAHFLVQRTQERIEQLREWLKGTEEGDVCAGSVQIRSAH